MVALESQIFTPYCIQRQMEMAGKYRRSEGGKLVRAWKPSSYQVRRMWALIIERDGRRCAYCGADEPGEQLELDHVTPYKHGGIFIESNLQILCARCNHIKAAKLPIVAAQ